MIDKKTVDKYDVLFESTIEFTCRIGLSKREDIECVTDDEIKAFCKKQQVALPPAIWSYTRFFGNGVGISNSDYTMSHNISNYLTADSLAKRRQEEYGNMNLKDFLADKNFKVNYDEASPDDNEGIYTPKLNSLMNIDDVFFYSYDSFNRSFKFVDSSKENPFVYYLTGYDTVTSYFSPFTDRFRDVLFIFIMNMAPVNFEGTWMFYEKSISITPTASIDYSDGFECIKIYQEIFKDLSVSQRENLKRHRNVFYELNNRIEQKENRVLSFTEFENNFIDFLKKEKWF